MAIQFRLESSNGFALAVNWELVVGSIESMGRMKIGLGSASTMITMWNVEGKRRLAIAWADGPRRSPLVKLILRTPTPLPGSDVRSSRKALGAPSFNRTPAPRSTTSNAGGYWVILNVTPHPRPSGSVHFRSPPISVGP